MVTFSEVLGVARTRSAVSAQRRIESAASMAARSVPMPSMLTTASLRT